MNSKTETRKKTMLKTVHADAGFVLQTTKGFTRKLQGGALKEQHREKYLNMFIADLNQKGSEKVNLENRKQLEDLREESFNLEKEISEYKLKLSTLGELAKTSEECLSSKKEEESKLLQKLEQQKMEIASLQQEVAKEQELLEKYLKYHEFLETLHQESGKEINTLNDLLGVFSGIEDQCITVMRSNQKIKKELKMDIMSEDISKTEREARLRNFQQPVNNINSSFQKLASKTEKQKAEIRSLEQDTVSTDTGMKKIVNQVNSTYRTCVMHSSIQVSTEMMLAEIEYCLYNLLDTMKTFPEEKLISAAKARRKEELRRQQEIRLEALKKK